MSLSQVKRAELTELLTQLCDGEMSRVEMDRLESLLLDDQDAQEFYRQFVALDVQLAWTLTRGNALVDAEANAANSESAFEGDSSRFCESEGTSGGAAIRMPSIVIQPVHGASPSLLNMNAPFGGMLFSYVASALIVSVGLFFGWMMKVSELQEYAVQEHAAPHEIPASRNLKTETKMVFVGRISGMLECQFSNDREIMPPPSSHAYVPLGRKYKLDSGLMEITYFSGARVILQGPAVFEVESERGGYLSLGKITAKLETKAEGGRGGDELSRHPDSLFPAPLSPFYYVKTPTAVITDMGTEFGVEVDRQGTTQSHVFQGKVSMVALDDEEVEQGDEVVLGANESARVESRSAGSSGKKTKVKLIASDSNRPHFVREISGAQRKLTLDLVDIVTGGNGTFGRRERGINPATGALSESWQPFEETSEQPYNSVSWQPLIDGVFVPKAGEKPVQLDSAGHTFDRFKLSHEKAESWGPIWAGKKMSTGGKRSDGSTETLSVILGGVDYGAAGHGALGMHANKGITFDLNAIRRRYPGWQIVNFRSVAGNTGHISAKKSSTEPYVSADVWVFVDGKVRVEKTNINANSKTIDIDIPILDTDCFLTLASTDGGNGSYFDHVMFGDPRLEMAWAGTERSRENGSRAKSGRTTSNDSTVSQ